MAITKEQIILIQNFIRSHKPQATDFSTIDVAIGVVTEGACRAVTRGEIAGLDSDLIPAEERNKFAGVSESPGLYQGFAPEDIKMIMDAVEFAKAAKSVEGLENNPDLKSMIEDPIMNNIEIEKDDSNYKK